MITVKTEPKLSRKEIKNIALKCVKLTKMNTLINNNLIIHYSAFNPTIQKDGNLQLEKLSPQLLMLRVGTVVSILPHHLLYEWLCKRSQGAAAATQTVLIGLLLLLAVRNGQPGQLLLQGRQSQTHTGRLSLFQAKQHLPRHKVVVSINVQQGELTPFFQTTVTADK